MKLLQLNIYQGKFLEEIIKFVKANGIDIVCMQEVTSGKWSHGGVSFYPDKILTLGANQSSVNIDCFTTLKKDLGYEGEVIKFIALKNDPESYEGNAIIYRNLQLLERSEIWMKPYQEYEKVEDARADMQPRSALRLKFEKEGKTFEIITTHLAWGPTPYDEDYKVIQAERLHESLKHTENPFILTGDFNVSSDTKTAKTFNDLGRNLAVESNIKNTLNERTHAVRKLFPPGLAVDYIFTTPGINVKSFRLVDEVDLSDHFGLLLEFDL